MKKSLSLLLALCMLCGMLSVTVLAQERPETIIGEQNLENGQYVLFGGNKWLVLDADMDLKKILSLKSIYVVSLVRLLVFPLLFIGVFALVPAAENIVVCAVCSLAMPLGLSTIVVPRGYGKDTSVAAGMTLVSHLLSAATIPVIFYLMTKVLI